MSRPMGDGGRPALFLRLALAAGFLSAVADRFGLWGAPGEPGVAWGTFESFLAYASTLNPYLPEAWIPALGWTVTVAEVGLAGALAAGWKTRWAALGSGLLLLAFAVGMTVGTGLKAPLDASVFAASAGAFLLARTGAGPLSLDRLRAGRPTHPTADRPADARSA